MESNFYNIDRFLIPYSHPVKSHIYRGEQQAIFNHLAIKLSHHLLVNQDILQEQMTKAIMEWERMQGETFASMRLEPQPRKIEVVEEVFEILCNALVSAFDETSMQKIIVESIPKVLEYYKSNFSDREFFN